MRFKRTLAAPYRLARCAVNPFLRMRQSIAGYSRYIRDLLQYSDMEGAEPIKFLDLHPCLYEKTATTFFDPHYFYVSIWAARRIVSSNATLHVDVGSQIGFVGLLTVLTKVIFIDIRPLKTSVENLESRRGSILAMPFEDCTVKSLSCLHVAEHIGLGRYGDPLDPQGTKKAAQELSRVLAVDGNLFFAVPLGKARLCFNAHRIHPSDQILRYSPSLDLIEFSGVDDRGVYHENLPLDALDDSRYACGFFWFKKRAAPNPIAGQETSQ